MSLNAIDKIIKSKLISCGGSLQCGKKSYCLDLNTFADIIRQSQSGALVYHVASNDRNSEELIPYQWSFPDLLDKLGDVSSYTILANTSRSINAKNAIETARIGVKYFDYIRKKCSHQLNPVIKLEVLNNNLIPDDFAVIEATRELVKNDHLTVIPFLTPNIENIHVCAEIGVPMVRILSGNIGSRSGLRTPSYLRETIKQAQIPIIIEGGIGTVQDVRQAIKLGATAVLVNSAFIFSKNPILLAVQIRKAIDSVTTQCK